MWGCWCALEESLWILQVKYKETAQQKNCKSYLQHTVIIYYISIHTLMWSCKQCHSGRTFTHTCTNKVDFLQQPQKCKIIKERKSIVRNRFWDYSDQFFIRSNTDILLIFFSFCKKLKNNLVVVPFFDPCRFFNVVANWIVP